MPVLSRTLTEDDLYGLPKTASFTWDKSQSSPAALGSAARVVTSVHAKMRRCVVSDAGVVQYYLLDTDSTKKANGDLAVLTGADGQVMVEIPKFYTRLETNGSALIWSISEVELPGYALHPAFLKDGVQVPYRYIGAYDACYWDATDSTYKSGLNLEDLTASLDLANDKLASVSGIYPIVGVTRAECRSLAANRGAGWRQLDFYLMTAVQLLYVIEYQSFFSQNILGAGNTNGTYLASSANQTDSPHTIAGASNSLGNGSTNITTGAGVSAKPGTSFMSYRGIENFYGNAWTWVDGVNINVLANGNVHVTNDSVYFADDTATGMQLLTSSLTTASNYVRDVVPLATAFLPNNVTGGSSTTYLTDYYFGSTSANRVLGFGGSADYAATAGVFCLIANNSSANSGRLSARLAR